MSTEDKFEEYQKNWQEYFISEQAKQAMTLETLDKLEKALKKSTEELMKFNRRNQELINKRLGHDQ